MEKVAQHKVNSSPWMSAERWCDPQKTKHSTSEKILFLLADATTSNEQSNKNCHKFCFVSPGGWGAGVSFRFLRFDYGNLVNYLLHLLRDKTTLCASRSRVAARVGDSAIKSQQQIMFHFFMLRLVCSRRKLCETFSFTYGVLHKTYSTRSLYLGLIAWSKCKALER